MAQQLKVAVRTTQLPVNNCHVLTSSVPISVPLLSCRSITNREHTAPGLAIIAAVGAAAQRGGAAWDSVKRLLPQVSFLAQNCICSLGQ